MLLGTGALTRLSGFAERSRAMALHNVAIEPPVRKRTTRTDWLRPFAQGLVDLTDPVTWRVLANHLVTMVLGAGLIFIIAAGTAISEWSTMRGAADSTSPAVQILAGVMTLLVAVLYILCCARPERVLWRGHAGEP